MALERWQIVFTDPDETPAEASCWRNSLLDAFLKCLKPGFRHVWAYRQFPDGSIMVVNPASNKLFCEQIPSKDRQQFFQMLHKRPRTQLTITAQTPMVWQPTSIVSCVHLICLLLGRSTPFLPTPYRLYRKLLSEPEL